MPACERRNCEVGTTSKMGYAFNSNNFSVCACMLSQMARGARLSSPNHSAMSATTRDATPCNTCLALTASHARHLRRKRLCSLLFVTVAQHSLLTMKATPLLQRLLPMAMVAGLRYRIALRAHLKCSDDSFVVIYTCICFHPAANVSIFHLPVTGFV